MANLDVQKQTRSTQCLELGHEAQCLAHFLRGIQSVRSFGGVATTVGAHEGNGINLAQIGHFDASGVHFDCPLSLYNDVSYHVDKSFCFSYTTLVTGACCLGTPLGKCVIIQDVRRFIRFGLQQQQEVPR